MKIKLDENISSSLVAMLAGLAKTLTQLAWRGWRAVATLTFGKRLTRLGDFS
jgi:hypothetical protein